MEVIDDLLVARKKRENGTSEKEAYYTISVEYAHIALQTLLVLIMCLILYVVGMKFQRENETAPTENAAFLAEHGINVETRL
jgi:uncharacterized membrane protein YukC